MSAEDAAVVLKTDDIMKRFASLSKPGGAISLKKWRAAPPAKA